MSAYMINFTLLSELIEQADQALVSFMDEFFAKNDSREHWERYQQEGGRRTFVNFLHYLEQRMAFAMDAVYHRISVERISENHPHIPLVSLHHLRPSQDIISPSFVKEGLIPIKKIDISCTIVTVHPFVPGFVDGNIDELSFGELAQFVQWLFVLPEDFMRFRSSMYNA